MAEPTLTRSLRGTDAAVRIASGGAVLARRVRLCRGEGLKFLGLMFRRSLSPEQGAVLIYSSPSRAMTSIHMFFVPFALGVFWLDAEGQVVDRVLALPWRPYYASRSPACYVLELHPQTLEKLPVGGRVEFHEADPRL